MEQGYDAFVMRELAESLDIKLGNLQYYFSTKEDIVLHVLEIEAESDRALIRESLESSELPEEAFRAVVAELVSRWRGASGVLMSILGALSQHNERYQQLYRQIYASFYDALEVLVAELNPDLPAPEIAVRVRLVTALVDGAPMQVRVGNRRAFLARVQRDAEAIALRPAQDTK